MESRQRLGLATPPPLQTPGTDLPAMDSEAATAGEPETRAMMRGTVRQTEHSWRASPNDWDGDYTDFTDCADRSVWRTTHLVASRHHHDVVGAWSIAPATNDP